MDFVTPLYRTLQAQATLDQTQATTQDTKALAQMRMLGVVAQQQQIERENQMRDALQKQFSNPTSPAAGAPPQQAQQQKDQEYPGEIFESLSQAREGVLRANNMVRLTGAYGDVKGNQKANENLDNQQKELRLALNDALKEKLRRNDEAAQIFGSVENSDQLVSALTYAANNLPKAQVARLAQQVYANLPDPATATPEQIKATLDPVRNQFIKGGDVLRAQSSATAAKIAQGNLEQRQQENVRRNAEAAMKQAGGPPESLTEGGKAVMAEMTLKGLSMPGGARNAGSVGIPAINRIAADMESEGRPYSDISEERLLYRGKQAVQKDFTSGPTAKNITSINTSLGHLSTLQDLGAAMKNNDVKVVNSFVNKVANQFGDPRINNYETAAQAVGEELMRTFRVVGASVTEAAKWQEKFENNHSPEQIEGSINTAADLLRSRLEALDDQWKRGTNSDKGFPDIISPKNQRFLESLGIDYRVTKKDSAGPKAGSEASDAAMNATVKGAATVGEVRAGRGGKQYKFKGGDPTDAKNWESVGG